MKPIILKAPAVSAATSAAILLALVFAACDNPGGPTPTRNTGGQTPTLTRLEIAGPDSVPPGAAQGFRATARFSDGSERDVTTQASWSSANDAIVSVSSSGQVTGRERGETDIRASYSQLVSTKRVMVLPSGTFKISGRVLDTGVEVPDARVAVTAGSATGLSTLSQNGRYALYGVSGPTQITVSKDGYQPRVENVDVSAHRTLDIYIAVLGPPWDPSGTYTLTIALAPDCRSALPEELWVRTYAAVVMIYTVNPRFVTVGLKGDGLETVNWWFWSGRIGENSVAFENVDYYGPVLAQRLTASKFFLIESGNVSPAKAEVTRSPTGLEGSFDGKVAIAEGAVWYNSTITAQCHSANHRMTFSR
jgi:Big-like domain-containing protein